MPHWLKKVKVKFSLSSPCRHVKGVEVELHPFLTAVLGGGEWAALRSGRFTPWKKLLYPLNGWLVGPQGRYGRFEGDNTFPCILSKSAILLR